VEIEGLFITVEAGGLKACNTVPPDVPTAKLWAAAEAVGWKYRRSPYNSRG